MTDWLQGAVPHYTDWIQDIDQTLLNAENSIREHDIVVDFPWGEFRLSSVVDGLRQGFELLFFQFPDPDLLRRQAHNLADLHDEGQAILKDFHTSLTSPQSLPAAWQGPSAEAYLGLQLGPMSDSQMEAYDQAHKDDPQPEGWRLHKNLTSMLAALDHNAQSHHDLAHTFDQVHDAQNGMRWMVVGGAADVALMAVQPETAPATLPTAAVTSEQVVEKTCFICRILPILAILASLALVTGGVYALVKSGIIPVPQDKGIKPSIPTGPIFPPIPPGVSVPKLTKEQEDLAEEFAAKYASDGCTKAEYENLIQRILFSDPTISRDQIRRIIEGLRLLSQLQRLERLLRKYPGFASTDLQAVGKELQDIIFDYFFYKSRGTYSRRDPGSWDKKLLDAAQQAYQHACSVQQVADLKKATDIDRDIDTCAGGKYPVDVYRNGIWTEVKSGTNNPPGAIAAQLWDHYISNMGCGKPPATLIEVVIPQLTWLDIGAYTDEVITQMLNPNLGGVGAGAGRVNQITSRFPRLPGEDDKTYEGRIRGELKKLFDVEKPTLSSCPPDPGWC